MKKWYLRFAGIALLLAGGLFLCSHATDFRYNDWWVRGRHMEEIAQRYGPFDLGVYQSGTKGRVGYYLYTNHGSLFDIDPDHLDYYYYIAYDENGIATEVYEACQPGG